MIPKIFFPAHVILYNDVVLGIALAAITGWILYKLVETGIEYFLPLKAVNFETKKLLQNAKALGKKFPLKKNIVDTAKSDTSDWNRKKISKLPLKSILFVGILFDTALLLILISFKNSLIVIAFSQIMIAAVAFAGYKIAAKKNRVKINQQIPMFLIALSQALQAGYSLPQAMECIVNEMPHPIAPHVRKVVTRIKLGDTFQNALRELKNDLKDKDMDFVVDSVVVQIKSGGDIIKIFRELGTSINERIKLEKDLMSSVSQGKLSGLIIALLWPASLLVFKILSPNYINILFESGIGKMLLISAILLEIAGFFWIYRITRLPI